MDTSAILVGVLCLIGGAAVAFLVLIPKQKKAIANAENEAEEIIKRAKDRAQDIKKTAKQEAKQSLREDREELEKEFDRRHQSLGDQERNLAKKELVLDQKLEQKENE